MRKILFSSVLCSFFLLSINAAQAGIVFTFGSNVTPERQAAIQAAATELEQIIHFRQTVKITISFDNLQCDSGGGVLGQAGPTGAFSNFPQAPQNNVWYVTAQAADLGHTTAKNEAVHIDGSFNNNLGNTGCIEGITWYFGTDHNPGVNQIDFLATAVHEFMHGLGFLSFIGSNGQLNGGLIDNYSTFLVDNSTGKSWKNMTAGERAASILNDSNLVWGGAKTTAMDSLLQTGKTNGKVRLFAPSSYESGSSTSHFDVSLFYNSSAHEVMEPYDAFPQKSIIASAAFCDMGWTLLRDTDGDGMNDCDDTDPLVGEVDTDGDGVSDSQDAFPSNAAASADTDNDGKPDAWNQPNPYACAANAPTCNGLTLDSDSDGDGVADATDNCPLVANANQLDWDNDGIGNVCGDDVPMAGISGAISKDKAGSAVAFAGDVNNDGYGDYVVGIPGYDIPATPTTKTIKDAGRAVVISGKTGLELMSVDGDAAKDAMGFAVAGGGDIDNDGFDDVVVGAPKADDVVNGLVDAGSVTVLYGPDGARTETVYGAAAKILSGSAVAFGDVNNDNHADIIVGAPKDDDLTHALVDAGSVKVFNGTNLSLVQTYFGTTTKAYAGTAVAAGKVDAIAGADIVIGAPNDDDVILKDTGSVTVYNISNANTFIMKKFGAVAKAFSGKSVASGDVNNDGRDDVIVGAPGDDDGALKDTGSVTVFSGNGGAQLAQQHGAAAKAGLGNSVAAGDVDGDGQADIIAGASKDDVPASDGARKIVDAGSLSIWRGAGFGLINTLYGETGKDYFGAAVGAGDINSDGKADLIIGIAGDDIPASKTIKDGGTVKIVSGVAVLPP
ncbi:MAG TPA: thrombospondin type 3 repeat-containing protein [Pseudomonadales bacterium]|nr:thrombospondin type 3 repeat-containing protein [Pseudomonadales bacterium]